MTATTTETLSVNGVVLNNLAYNIESLTGRLRAPAFTTANITVPGRHGTIRIPNKRYEEGQVVLPMWVMGNDVNGGTLTPRQSFFANLDTLNQLFRPGAGLLQVVHTLPDGSQRQCWAECLDAMDMTTDAGGNLVGGKFSVALRLPVPFWEDPTLQTINLGMTWNGDLGPLNGTTAPIEDSVAIITGPFTSVQLEARYNGGALDEPLYWSYSGVVGTGQTLTVDSGAWKMTGGGGLAPDYTKLFHTGGTRWLTIPAGPVGGNPQVKLTTVGGVAGTSKVTLQARRKFLVG